MAAASDDGNVRPRSGGQSMLARHRSREQSLPPPFAARMAQEGADPRKGRFFTLGVKEGFNQWWASLSPAAAEHSVLSHIPYLEKPPAPAFGGSKSNCGSSSAPESAVQSTVTITSPEEQRATEDPYGPRKWATDMVTLSGKDRQLNEFSITRLNDEPSTPKHDLVILHGYGAGLAFFYKNFESLSRRPGWRLFALDLPGMGRSSRPPFRIHAKDRQEKIEEAESWFVDALEEWRIKRKLEKFTLLGHSLGGYMAVAYALKYPGRLEKLILASPVGIPEDPWAMNAEMPDSSASGSSANLTKGKGDVIEDANVGAAPAPPRDNDDHKDQNNFLNARKAAAAKAGSENGSEAPQGRTRPYPKWLVYLWDANVSPFSLVRWAGPLGPRLVSGWTSRRFSHLPPKEAESLHDYSYSLFRQRGSGEYALAHILAPGAFARSPLIRRIGEIGRGWVSEESSSSSLSTAKPETNGSASASATVSSTMGHTTSNSSSSASDQHVGKKRENGIPVVFLYGEHDWMDVKGGHAAVRKLEEARKRAIEGKSAEEAAKDKGDAKIYVIKGAGHHVYLDGPDEFNEVMAKVMEDTEKRAQS